MATNKLNVQRYTIFVILIILSLQLLVSACSSKQIVSPFIDYYSKKSKISSRKAERRFPLQTKQLTVLFDGNPYNYAVVEGTPVGLAYELINLFAKEQGLELKVKVAGKEHLLDSMQAGAADIAASDQNGTILDKTNLAYSVPLLKSDLRLIQKSAAKADNATESSVFDTTRINGKKVVIPKNAAIKKALIAYAKKHHLRFTIIQAAAHLSQEDLIQMVAQGEIDYTVSDGIIAEQMSSSFKNIDCHTSIADSYQVSWVVNKQSLGLSDMFDAWVAKKGRSLEFNVILNKYTKLSKAEKKALQNQYKYAKTGSISTYDDLLRKHASAANLDWRLLAALVYQESKFNPQATSSAGAIGLMQVLPATAKWLGNNPRLLKSPEANIEAGLQYLLWLKSKWRVYISDEKELIKFTLASYNAGFGHVQDAYELAKKYKLNPLKWEGNVERMLGRKSDSSYYNDPTVRYGYCRGKEPVEYVQKIMHYYHHYQNNM